MEDALRILFPSLADDDLRNAAEQLDEYLLLAWEIMQDVGSVPDDTA